jgi:dipeptidyl aminopeptidase/acylaminoacyl peptidase
MNERNGAALFQAVREFHECDIPDCGECRKMAEWLASRGVLVPSALVPGDGHKPYFPAHWFETYERTVDFLERLAKGTV